MITASSYTPTQTLYPGRSLEQVVPLPTAGFQLKKVASEMPFALAIKSQVSSLYKCVSCYCS